MIKDLKLSGIKIAKPNASKEKLRPKKEESSAPFRAFSRAEKRYQQGSDRNNAKHSCTVSKNVEAKRSRKNMLTSPERQSASFAPIGQVYQQVQALNEVKQNWNYSTHRQGSFSSKLLTK